MQIFNKIKNILKYIIKSFKIYKILRDIKAEKGTKILLFGAFGNGNMGDAEQANFVKDILRKNQFSKKYQVMATSYLKINSYNFEGNTLPCY